MPLTDAWLKAAHRKPRTAVAEKSDREGMSARVTLTGKIVFQLRYRYQGKAVRMDLGTYPAMTLKQARDEALKRRGQLEQGQDPRMLKRVEHQATSDAHTNESLVRLWHEKWCEPNKAGAGEILRSFELHVFPTVGKLPADSTTLQEWVKLMEGLSASRPRIAERVLTNLKQAHKWGCKRGLIQQQPLAAFSARVDFNVNASRQSGRSLPDDQLWLLWHAMDRSRMARRSKLYVTLCLAYGCRPGELQFAKQSEFDFKAGVWEIPPERHKTGKKTGTSLRRPIIPAHEDLLREAMALSHDKTMLFTAESSAKPMHVSSMLSYPYNIMQAAKRHLGAELPHWSLYDLRKTARTNWSTIAQPHICEIMLGHKLPAMWAVYDRYDYIEEQAAAYQAWWDRITQLVSADPPTL